MGIDTKEIYRYMLSRRAVIKAEYRVAFAKEYMRMYMLRGR